MKPVRPDNCTDAEWQEILASAEHASQPTLEDYHKKYAPRPGDTIFKFRRYEEFLAANPRPGPAASFAAYDEWYLRLSIFTQGCSAVPPRRKVVQRAMCGSDGIVALCDDGTIWQASLFSVSFPIDWRKIDSVPAPASLDRPSRPQHVPQQPPEK